MKNTTFGTKMRKRRDRIAQIAQNSAKNVILITELHTKRDFRNRIAYKTGHSTQYRVKNANFGTGLRNKMRLSTHDRIKNMNFGS